MFVYQVERAIDRGHAPITRNVLTEHGALQSTDQLNVGAPIMDFSNKPCQADAGVCGDRDGCRARRTSVPRCLCGVNLQVVAAGQAESRLGWCLDGWVIFQGNRAPGRSSRKCESGRNFRIY